MLLQNKVAIITGGGNGIVREMALPFCEEWDRVINNIFKGSKTEYVGVIFVLILTIKNFCYATFRRLG